MKGYTLIELMIVLTILAILATLSTVSYQHHITKERRADGQQALLAQTIQIEKQFAKTGTYQGIELTTPGKVSEFYEVSVITATNAQYALMATPKGAQQKDGLLVFWSTGLRGHDQDNSLAGTIDIDHSHYGLSASELNW